MSERKEVPLAETARRYFRNQPAQKSPEKSLLERFLSLPFKFAGAFLGIDEETIRRKRYYGDDSTRDLHEESSFEIQHLQDIAPSINSVRTEYIEAYTLHKQTGGPLVLNLNTSGLTKDEVTQAIMEAESYLDSVGYK